MSGRGNIVNGRLVYSCNCGRLDRTHAGMGGCTVIPDIEDCVHNLWKQIYRERDEKCLGATPAITMVLHTWTRDLRFHPHVQAIVSAGGLRAGEPSHWVHGRPRYQLAQKEGRPRAAGSSGSLAVTSMGE